MLHEQPYLAYILFPAQRFKMDKWHQQLPNNACADWSTLKPSAPVALDWLKLKTVGFGTNIWFVSFNIETFLIKSFACYFSSTSLHFEIHIYGPRPNQSLHHWCFPSSKDQAPPNYRTLPAAPRVGANQHLSPNNSQGTAVLSLTIPKSTHVVSGTSNEPCISVAAGCQKPNLNAIIALCQRQKRYSNVYNVEPAPTIKSWMWVPIVGAWEPLTNGSRSIMLSATAGAPSNPIHRRSSFTVASTRINLTMRARGVLAHRHLENPINKEQSQQRHHPREKMTSWLLIRKCHRNSI